MTTLILFAAAVFLSVLLISYYTYCITFYSPPGKRHSLDDPMHGEQYEAVSEHIYRAGHIMERYPFEKVEIHSFDNCKLFGRYYHVRDGAPLIILFHGYRSCAFRDCSGGHALSRKLGFNALVIDQRAHGRSGSYTITFGIKERRDCLCWIEYANGRFGTDTPIILSGISLGAATILMAAGLNLPRNVSCIMADSPYSAPSAIIEKVCTVDDTLQSAISLLIEQGTRRSSSPWISRSGISVWVTASLAVQEFSRKRPKTNAPRWIKGRQRVTG